MLVRNVKTIVSGFMMPAAKRGARAGVGKSLATSAGSAEKPLPPTLPLTWEQRLCKKYGVGSDFLVVGVDEAGRGPLAGPVVAAAVGVLTDGKTTFTPPIEGINDSKTVEEDTRERLYEELISCRHIEYGVSVVTHDVIDTINILQATMKAMENAVIDLQTKLSAKSKTGDSPSLYVLVDGPRLPTLLSETEPAGAGSMPSLKLVGSEPVVQGDAKVYSIAAASLIAKVTRDRIMRELDAKHPQYGFATHKGYGTQAHMNAIWEHGPSPVHRMTFAPLKTWYPKETPAVQSAKKSAAAKRKEKGASSAGAKVAKIVEVERSVPVVLAEPKSSTRKRGREAAAVEVSAAKAAPKKISVTNEPTSAAKRPRRSVSQRK